MLVQLSATLLLLVPVCARIYKNDSIDFSTCTVYYAHGNNYANFFNLDQIKPSAKLNGTNPNLLIDFHFSVLAVSDAHILLAPSYPIENQQPVYEIVIGAGGNTFCDIRRMVKSAVKASIRIKGLLSAVDIKSFWIHIDRSGVIEVGNEGEELAFITWTDGDLLPIEYVSFSTWRGIESKWFFGCKNDEHIEEVVKELTPLDKLRRDLLTNYDPYVRPVKDFQTPTNVSVTIITDRIHLDEQKSFIEVGGTMKLIWKDEKLQWDPKNYSGINNLHIFRREIWQPDLILFNAVEDSRSILQDTLLRVHYNGQIEWRTTAILKSWCDARDRGDWPNDYHDCSLIIGLHADALSTFLVFNTNESRVMYEKNSEWDIIHADINANMNNTTFCSMRFIIKRQSTVYNLIFVTPFVFIAISMLLIFWISPFSQMKIALGCFQLVLSTIILLALALYIPNHPQQIPFLISLYSSSLIATLIAIIISIIVINISRIERSNAMPHFLEAFLTSKILKIMFCLPGTETSQGNGKFNMIAKNYDNPQAIWIILGVLIDRIAFIIYVPIIIYTMYLSY